MAIPKLKKQDVIDALKFIDENDEICWKYIGNKI